MSIRSLFASKHRRLEANLDAYLDDALEGHEMERFLAHLAVCDACARRVEDGRRLKTLFASLPELPAPRSFAITESMLQPARRPAAEHTGLWTGLVRGCQGTAAAGVALLAVLVVADLSGGSAGTGADEDAFQTTGLTAPADASRESADAKGAVSDSAYDSDNDGGNGDSDGSQDDATSQDMSPEGTPSPQVGAAANDHPDQPPQVESDDDAEAAGNTAGTLPESASIAADDDDAPASSEVLLYEGEDSGGVDRLRWAQFIVGGLALVAGVSYFLAQRLAPRGNR